MKRFDGVFALVVLCFLSVGIAHGQVIYFDSFTGTDGDLLVEDVDNMIPGRSPEVNNGVVGVEYEGPTTVWQRDIQGNTARLGADTYANIDITSSGSYVQPQQIRISAIMDLGTTGGPAVPDGTEPTRGVGLGFYADAGPNIFVNTDFRGLILTTDGRLVLGRTGENSSPRVGTVQDIVTGLDNSGQNMLSFEIDTTTGDMSNIMLNGVLQPDVTTTLFNADVNRAGFFASSSGGGTSAFFDDFEVSGIGSVTPGRLGDYNEDDAVDLADYTLWRNNLGADRSVLPPGTTTSPTGTIDSSDYDTWRSNYGADYSLPPATTASVPEPTAVALIGLAVMGLLITKRKRS